MPAVSRLLEKGRFPGGWVRVWVGVGVCVGGWGGGVGGWGWGVMRSVLLLCLWVCSQHQPWPVACLRPLSCILALTIHPAACILPPVSPILLPCLGPSLRPHPPTHTLPSPLPLRSQSTLAPPPHTCVSPPALLTLFCVSPPHPTAEERRVAICLMDDVLEHSPAGGAKYAAQVGAGRLRGAVCGCWGGVGAWQAGALSVGAGVCGCCAGAGDLWVLGGCGVLRALGAGCAGACLKGAGGDAVFGTAPGLPARPPAAGRAPPARAHCPARRHRQPACLPACSLPRPPRPARRAQVMPLLLQGCTDRDPTVRQCSVYGLGCAAQHRWAPRGQRGRSNAARWSKLPGQSCLLPSSVHAPGPAPLPATQPALPALH